MLLKFNSCLTLMSNLESLVRSGNDIWKVTYHLNMPTDETIVIKDDDNDSDDDDGNIPLVIVIDEDMQGLMEERKEEEKEEVEEDKGEDDLVRTSLPHTPPNTITFEKIASTSEIMSTIVTSITQSSHASS